jgi:hypothetical protein
MFLFRALVIGTVLLGLSILATCVAAQEPVVPGPDNDDQATVAIPWNEPSSRLVVFERLGPAPMLLGDLWMTRSSDSGATWSAPTPIIATTANERHPSLVQIGDNAYALFYLSNATGSFRIHRAVSDDGTTFTAQGSIDLGPDPAGELNPYVIRDAAGTLTMTYHRGAAYLARSFDDGVTWDTLRTQVSLGTAALPRITWRTNDSMYLLAYQTGSSPVTIWIKTSTDPYDWSAPPRQLLPDGNNHDAFPSLMPDGSFVVLWARVVNNAFQLFSTRSLDGVIWQPIQQHTDRSNLNNVQPYALSGPTPAAVELYWGAGQQPGNGDFDIVREPAVIVADALFEADFETAP